MKTFEDIEFEKHPYFEDGVIGKLNFDNGYGVSVVNGIGDYTNSSAEYEVAIFKNDNFCYSIPIADDVIGYCSSKVVTEIMKQVQELKY